VHDLAVGGGEHDVVVDQGRVDPPVGVAEEGHDAHREGEQRRGGSLAPDHGREERRHGAHGGGGPGFAVDRCRHADQSSR
jgi:hypothetical protein